jgi:Sugar (and other) transporter
MLMPLNHFPASLRSLSMFPRCFLTSTRFVSQLEAGGNQRRFLIRRVFPASHNRIRFRILSGIALQAWLQLSGIDFIFYIGTSFFTKAGIHSPHLISIAISSVNVAVTILASGCRTFRSPTPASCRFQRHDHLRIHHRHHRFDHVTGQPVCAVCPGCYCLHLHRFLRLYFGSRWMSR